MIYLAVKMDRGYTEYFVYKWVVTERLFNSENGWRNDIFCSLKSGQRKTPFTLKTDGDITQP